MPNSDSDFSEGDSVISDSSAEFSSRKRQSYRESPSDSGGSYGSDSYDYGSRSRGSDESRSRSSYDDEGSRSSQSRASDNSGGSYDDRSRESDGRSVGSYEDDHSRDQRSSYDNQSHLDSDNHGSSEISDSDNEESRAGEGSQNPDAISGSDEEASQQSKDSSSRIPSDDEGSDNDSRDEGTGNYGSSSGGNISDSTEENSRVSVEEKEPSPAKSDANGIVGSDETDDAIQPKNDCEDKSKRGSCGKKASQGVVSDSEGDEPSLTSAGSESKASSSDRANGDSDEEKSVAAHKKKDDISRASGRDTSDSEDEASASFQTTKDTDDMCKDSSSDDNISDSDGEKSVSSQKTKDKDNTSRASSSGGVTSESSKKTKDEDDFSHASSSCGTISDSVDERLASAKNIKDKDDASIGFSKVSSSEDEQSLRRNKGGGESATQGCRTKDANDSGQKKIAEIKKAPPNALGDGNDDSRASSSSKKKLDFKPEGEVGVHTKEEECDTRGDESISNSKPNDDEKEAKEAKHSGKAKSDEESREEESDKNKTEASQSEKAVESGFIAKDKEYPDCETDEKSEEDSFSIKKGKTEESEKTGAKKSSDKTKKEDESEEESSEVETDGEEEEASTTKKANGKAEAKKNSGYTQKKDGESEEESSEHDTDSEEEEAITKKKSMSKVEAKKSGGKAKKNESDEEESSECETDCEEEGENSTKNKTNVKGSDKAAAEKKTEDEVKKAGKNKKKDKKSKDGDDSSEYESISGEEVSLSENEDGDPSVMMKASDFVCRRSGQFTEYYDLQDLIGKGAFASVYSAKSKETGAIRAAKELKKSEENETNNMLVLNEFELLKDIDHPNLIKVYELFESDQNYFLVTEICKGGSLKDELMSSGLYTEKRAAVFMKQLLTCVKYFHNKDIVHRDLKPGNILLEEKNTYKIRIIDFGMATRCKEDDRLSEPMGTPAYMAPEVLGMNYGRESDLWSCGVLLFLVLSGQQAFKGSTTEETFTNIVTGEFSFADPAWKPISDEAKDFIKKLLTWDERSRLTAGQALQDEWILSNCPSRPNEDMRSSAVGAAKNLEGFDAQSKLKLATCTFIASKLLPQPEKARIDEIFQAINNDGRLTRDEVKIGYKAVLGRDLRNFEVDQIFRNVDADVGGLLEYPEFVFGAMSAKELLSEENLSKVFQVFDREKTGYITMQELKDLLKFDLSLGKKTIKMIMAEVDKEEDGHISYDEFLSMAAVPHPARKSAATDKQPLGKQESKSDVDDTDSNGVTPAGIAACGSKGTKQRSLDSFLQENDQTESEMDLEDFDLRSQGSLSIKLSATQFVSHRLGKLTEHYEIIDYIAKGSYGVVCSALHKETGTTRAIKELKKSKKNKEKNELLLKLFEDKRHYYIVTGVSEGGDLHREIKARGSFAEDDAAVLMRQILICVNYCHKQNIVHRDLKPGNILLEEHKKLNHIKIIDFGEAIVSEPTAKLTEVAGTMAYMAPEVLAMDYNHKCDIWSCGVIAYLVLSGKQPLRGSTDQETFSNIVKGNISFADPIWEELSSDAQDFVKLLLTWEVSLRPSAEDALAHPWIVKAAQNKTSVYLRKSTMEALSNIEAFDAQSKLRVATCAFIASQLMDKEEKEKIDDVFRAIDLNSDGTLNREEVKQGYENYFDRELSDEEIDAIFKHVDADGTGELEYSEFLFGALDKQNLLSQENLKKAFSIFDTSGDGDITFQELKLLLNDSLTQDESIDDRALNKLIAQVDLDGDGKISYEEFVKMALGHPSGAASSEGRKEGETRKGILKETRDRDSLKEEKSVAFSEVDDSEDRNKPSIQVSLPVEVIGDDSSSRHLQKAIISRASQPQIKSRSNQDPPIHHRRADPPPSEEQRRNALKSHGLRVSDPEPLALRTTQPYPSQEVSPLPCSEVHLAPPLPPTYRKDKPMPSTLRMPTTYRSCRMSPRDVKIDEACQGFDRVQEKIARLRALLEAQDTYLKKVPHTNPKHNRNRKHAPNMETLDSAFTKLSQIQSKMRALQALVKSDQV